jgi:hypothetical protein
LIRCGRLAVTQRQNCGKQPGFSAEFPASSNTYISSLSHPRQFKRLAIPLRRTRGELEASQLAAWSACGRIWIFARRRDGRRQLRGVSGRHEIAENIPRRSRSFVTFRWACAQIEQCARDGGRSRDSVNSNPPRGIVAFDRF